MHAQFAVAATGTPEEAALLEALLYDRVIETLLQLGLNVSFATSQHVPWNDQTKEAAEQNSPLGGDYAPELKDDSTPLTALPLDERILHALGEVSRGILCPGWSLPPITAIGELASLGAADFKARAFNLHDGDVNLVMYWLERYALGRRRAI